jgi:hypothetical protein
MEATNETYQVWDDETGNVIAKFGTLKAAVDFLQAMFNEHGAAGVSELAVIEYPADGSAPRGCLEGADFLAQCHAPV